MGDAALGMLATRMTLLNGMASFRIRTIAAEFRPTEATQTRNPSMLIAESRIASPNEILEAGGTAPGGDDEERRRL